MSSVISTRTVTKVLSRTLVRILSRTFKDLSVPLVPRLYPGHSLVECSKAACEDVHEVSLVEDFVNWREQESLMKEVEMSMRRKRYQYDHWDGVRIVWVAN